jgi:hypothetical protein
VRRAFGVAVGLSLVVVSTWRLVGWRPLVLVSARASTTAQGVSDRSIWQHPVRGYFGDPRTVFSGKGEPALSFHNGVDISSWRGNSVYPVVSGRVVEVDGDRIVVQATVDRRFQYIHVLPYVRVGRRVVASRTVLGVILSRWGHLHLTEIRGGCAVNPLARGHLAPFRDDTRPQVRTISFEDPAGRLLRPTALSGDVRVIAEALDWPALPAPGQWGRMPVVPALITWRLSTVRGQVLAAGVGADFRFSEPPPAQFCSVYAPGTLQNFAVVDGVYRWDKPGRYLFDLTARPLSTSRLHAGRYRFTVTASNLGHHSATRTVAITIQKRQLTRITPARPDTRCN